MAVVGQRRQAPFALNLRQALEQKGRITKPAFDRAQRVFSQGLAQLEPFRGLFHPGRHRFHQMFVGLAGEGAIGLVPRAAALQGAAFAAAGPVVFQFPAEFAGAEPTG